MSKQFKINPEDIQPLVPTGATCMVSDMVAVDGKPVGYMYREEPDEMGGSGWVFMSGYESDDYADNSANISLVDVNFVANLDPKVIQFLDAPYGSAFELDDHNNFVEIRD